MKILLNYLPPADVHSPSISLAILKKFMLNNGIETAINYWNFSLSLMSDYSDSEDTEIRLLPFLSILNDQFNHTTGNDRITTLLQKLQPTFNANNPTAYSEILEEKKEKIYETIQRELKAIDFSEILLFGISAKYNQWIPGMLLAEEVKKIAPNVKIIVGGFSSDKDALEAMKLCSHFDFVTWGEGEYPLLNLYEQLSNESPQLNKVPRLFYREGNEISQPTTNKSEYLDFKNYIFPNYDDFITKYPYPEETHKINFPINTIRSCHWSKCKFCDFNKGYKLRVRSPECIVKEIEQLTNEHGITTFSFTDSDTFGTLAHFEKLLDLIIALKYENEEDYVFWAEIIPNATLTAKLMQKMAIAGFKNIFIGYDALSDSLLEKMNKSNSFADNIFVVKHALKNGITPIVNVIKHVPEETAKDVQECMNNLHFLRFYYNNSIVSFSHIYVSLVLSSMSKYYTLMSPEERENYATDDLTYLMPPHFSNNDNRFHLFRYKKNVPNNVNEWDKLTEKEDYYKTNTFNYTIQENNGILYYTEYCNDVEIENIVFGEMEYGFILKAVADKTCTFTEVYADIKKTFPELTEQRLKEMLLALKKDYLIYCDTNFSTIVGVIEV